MSLIYFGPLIYYRFFASVTSEGPSSSSQRSEPDVDALEPPTAQQNFRRNFELRPILVVVVVAGARAALQEDLEAELEGRDAAAHRSHPRKSSFGPTVADDGSRS